MLTPRYRSRRAYMLAALFALLACGKDGDHYAPLPDKPETPTSMVVAGLVQDGGDHSVADAVVVIEPTQNGVTATALNMTANPGASSESTPGRRVTVTDDSGRFAFAGVAKGDYFLQVIADDHLGAIRSFSVPTATAVLDTIIVDVNLTPTGTFTGVAALENAIDHQGTVVYAQGTSYVAVTDPYGNYALTDVPVGTYTVRAEHAHYLHASTGGTITTAGEVVPLAAMLLKIDSNIPPVATIVSASPQVQNVPVNFVATGTDADGTVVLYEWDWEDDGTFDYSSPTTANTSHTYASGNVTAKLRVTDNDGAIGLAAVQLVIDPNQAPTATIVNASPQQDGVPVNFTANGSDPDGVIVLYQWDWEDNGSFDASSPSTGNASHLYAPGNYTARFRVTDDDGAIDDDTVAITIVQGFVYMSWRGNDSNPGTSGSPVLTLPVAYTTAQSSGITTILIEDGFYTGAPAFVAGINVLGGRTWPTWVEGLNQTVFSYSATRATANSITTNTLIRRIKLNMTLPAGGTNSIALYSTGSSALLRFEECEFVSANGVNGAAGVNGSLGASANNGSPGGSGSCDGGPLGGAGGSGGASPAGCSGGVGGQGGPEGSNSGFTGGAGACAGGAGGGGGSGGDPGSPGLNGVSGGSGALGSAGPGGSGGSVIGGEWIPNNGGNGGTGQAGRGGGGGGGGGGQGGTFVDDGSGNGGGGGGGGGAGGTGGTSGTGGRASLAVMLVTSSPTFDTCRFQTGIGGIGGNGGNGAGGGAGGSGGVGGAFCTGEVGRGGNGGNGGNGGQGGGGGGAAGGVSYGIYRASGSVPSIVNPTYTIGGGGNGGSGGTPNGINGATGASGNLF